MNQNEIFSMIRPCHQMVINQNGLIRHISPKLQFIIDNNPDALNLLINFVETTSKDKAGLLIINSFINSKHIRGMYLYLVRVNWINDQLVVELYNIIKLSNLIKTLFSSELWSCFKALIADNSNNFASQQLYLAHETLMSLFLISNLSKSTAHAKSQYEFGELLFYFNPYSKTKDKSKTSGRNALKTSLPRSEHEIKPKLMAGLKIADDAIIGNYLLQDQLIPL